MKKVLIYKTNILGYSETFIKQQVLFLKNWHGVLVGVDRSRNGLDLSEIDVRLLKDLKTSRWQRLRWKLARHFDLPPAGVVERLARENAQLVHIHFGTEAVQFWPAAKALNVPTLVTLHGFDINTHRDWWESGKGGHWMRGYPRRLLQMAASDRVTFIAVSKAIREQAIAFGIPAEKVFVRYIGIDVREFTPGTIAIDKRKPRVLFVGRLVEKKGLSYLIEAFAKIREAVPGAELVVAGDGPLRVSMQQLADRLCCPVTFLGSISASEVKRQMDTARVFCLPSITAPSGDAEGLPMVILEAQACGVPVITSARGGAKEGIVDGKTGFAHAEGDIDQLANAVLRLLTDAPLAETFSIAARIHVEQNFDIARCNELLEETYDNVSNARPRMPVD